MNKIKRSKMYNVCYKRFRAIFWHTLRFYYQFYVAKYISGSFPDGMKYFI